MIDFPLLASLSAQAAERLRVHASLVRSVQRGEPMCDAVVVSRIGAVSVLSDLFERLKRLPAHCARHPFARVAESLEWRVDPFKVGALDVEAVETMAEWLGECAVQLRMAAASEEVVVNAGE